MCYRAVSLFSGCGGFCEGIKKAGFDIVCSVECDKYACETYRYNFPDSILYEGDVRNFLRTNKQSPSNEELDGIDIVFGGPPCQGYSQIGTRTLDDQRNYLFKEFSRVVSVLKPKIFLLENVPNLLMLRSGYFSRLIIEQFKKIGFSRLHIFQLKASDFGVPQDRERVFFVGLNDEVCCDIDVAEIIESTLQSLRVDNPTTVFDAISDLPRKVVPSGHFMNYPSVVKSPYQKVMRLDCDSAIYSAQEKTIRDIFQNNLLLVNHHTKEIQEKRLALIKLLKPGKKADSLPKNIWDGKRPEKWRRLDPDKPSYTILANMHRDLSEFVHPYLDRWITVREAARLQSFHDGFIFKTSEWQMLKQIGNAVPPLLARAIGIGVKEVLARICSSCSPSIGHVTDEINSGIYKKCSVS